MNKFARTSCLASGVVILTISGYSFAQPQQAPDADLVSLKAAAYYAIGFTGVGGMQSPGQTAMVHLHQKQNREALIREAYSDGSPAAKLYASCWASSFNKDLFQVFNKDLLKSLGSSTVPTMTGSVMAEQKVADVLHGMSSGQCGTLMVSGVE